MFNRIRDWVRRNGTGLVVGAGVIGATYLGASYALSKLQESRLRSSEERLAKDNLKRRFQTNQEDTTFTVLALLPAVRDEIFAALPVEDILVQLQQQKEERLRRLGVSEAPSSGYPSAPPSAVEDDGKSLSSLQSSSFIHTSQIAQSTPSLGQRSSRTKAQLWNDMKINSIARALTLIYTLSLLTLLTRIQLNLLGRRTYLSSVVALASPPAPTQSSTISLENRDDDNYDNVYGNDFETNRKYLTFSWWLLHRGSKQIRDRVVTAVKEVFGGVNIREELTLERLGELILQVRRKVEGSTEAERRSLKWLSYLLPSNEDEAFVIRQSTMSDSDESPFDDRPSGDPMAAAGSGQASGIEYINPSLRRLLDETSDLVDSPTFTFVLTRILDTAFSHLIDFRVATEAFKATGPTPPGLSQDGPRIIEINESKCKLVHILPVFSRQAHTIGVGSGELDTIAGVAAQEALGNEYLAAIDSVHELEAFAAVIYSSNFEYELPEASTPSDTAGRSPYAQPAADRSFAELLEASSQLTDLPAQPTSGNSLNESEVLVGRYDGGATAGQSRAKDSMQSALGESEFLAVTAESEPTEVRSSNTTNTRQKDPAAGAFEREFLAVNAEAKAADTQPGADASSAVREDDASAQNAPTGLAEAFTLGDSEVFVESNESQPVEDPLSADFGDTTKLGQLPEPENTDSTLRDSEILGDAGTIAQPDAEDPAKSNFEAVWWNATKAEKRRAEGGDAVEQ